MIAAIDQHVMDAGFALLAEGDFLRGGRHGTGHRTSGQLSLPWFLSLDGRVPRLPPGTLQVLPTAPVGLTGAVLFLTPGGLADTARRGQ
jgi:hypothetical protein